MPSTKLEVVVNPFDAEFIERRLAVIISEIISKRIEAQVEFYEDKVKVYDKLLEALKDECSSKK